MSCYFCGESITKFEGRISDSLAVHHINGDHEDDRPDNRAKTHYGCHASYHSKLQSETPEGKAQFKKMLKAWHESDENKAHIKKMQKAWYESDKGKTQIKKLGEANKGKHLSEAHKQACRDGWMRRKELSVKNNIVINNQKRSLRGDSNYE